MKINFHLPGLNNNAIVNVLLVKLLERYPEYFRDNVNIASFYGEFPISLWNGGRQAITKIPYTTQEVSDSIKIINDLGVSVKYTFTNLALTEEDLNDEFCNFCLQEAHNEMNAVIVTSPLLEQYIRQNYPKYQIVSSTCKCLTNLSDVQNELKKDYSLVVLDYNFNHSQELFQIEQKERCEILVNPGCQQKCPVRFQHYQCISENQKKIVHNMYSEDEQRLEQFICPFKNSEINDGLIDATEIWEQLIPAGFCNFKIQGRNADPDALIKAYMHYLVKPEYQDKVQLLYYQNLMKNDLLTFQI